MAYSDVLTKLDGIGQTVVQAKTRLTAAKEAITRERAKLANLPSAYSDILAEIDKYASADEAELLAKSMKTKLLADVTALRDAAVKAETALAAITEF